MTTATEARRRYRDAIERAGAYAAEQLWRNDAVSVEVVVVPGNGSRYSIVLARPTGWYTTDPREYATVTGGGKVLVALPDFRVAFHFAGPPGVDYVEEKLRLRGQDAQVVTDFLAALFHHAEDHPRYVYEAEFYGR